MVKHQLPKLRSGVRFPSPAPDSNAVLARKLRKYGIFIIPKLNKMCCIICRFQRLFDTNATRNATQNQMTIELLDFTTKVIYAIISTTYCGGAAVPPIHRWMVLYGMSNSLLSSATVLYCDTISCIVLFWLPCRKSARLVCLTVSSIFIFLVFLSVFFNCA